MWKPRHLTTLWAFTACYKDSFFFTIIVTNAKLKILYIYTTLSLFSNSFIILGISKKIIWTWQTCHGPHRQRLFHYCVFSRCQENVSTELFPTNGCCTVTCLHMHSLFNSGNIQTFQLPFILLSTRWRTIILPMSHPFLSVSNFDYQ
jgi:hypothetical protein